MESLPPKDLSHHYSRVVQRTEPSIIKKLYPHFMIPGIGNLAGGLPDPAYFPYDTLEARVALADRFKPTPNDPVEPSPPQQHNGQTAPDKFTSAHLLVPHDSPETDRNQKIDLATALEYGTAQGYPPLRLWIREFTRTKMHPNVPYNGGPEVILTHGSTDGFSKVLHAFTDVWDDRKDWIRDRQGFLCEEFAYMSAIQAAKPKGLNVVTVAMDAEGMKCDGPRGLRDILENWDRTKGRVPHLMYTVTVGQNPTSAVLSLERKRRIYALCQRYDILIVEDDPYWFLQYPSANELSIKHRGKPIASPTSSSNPGASPSSTGHKPMKSSGSAFLDSLVPSYLSIDIDGRVIRLDTFSKTVAPGCRLGWITAQPAIVDQIFSFTDLVTQQPNGFAQSMIAQLIVGQSSSSMAARRGGGETDKRDGKSDLSWQMDGWIRWLEGLRGNYERRMQVMSQVLEDGKYKVGSTNLSSNAAVDDFEVVSKKQLFDFTFPMGGMFLWLHVHFENHPLYGHPAISIEKLSTACWILQTTPKYRVLTAPGWVFAPTDKIKAEKSWYYFRMCFAAVPEDILRTMSHTFIQACSDFFDIDDPREIEDIVNGDAANSPAGVAQLAYGIRDASLLDLPRSY